MSPDSYIRIEPGDFDVAMAGHPRFVRWAYFCLLKYYRCHNHCNGLENRDSFLKTIAECETEAEWKEVKDFLFDNDKFFTMDENGFWHQKRAEQDYALDCGTLKTYVHRGKKGSDARWRKKK